MNKSFRLKFQLIIVLIFSASSMVNAQNFINRRLSTGETLEWESGGVAYKFLYDNVRSGCYLYDLIAKKHFIGNSLGYNTIAIKGDFIAANKYKRDKYDYWDIYNLQGKLIYTTPKNTPPGWPGNDLPSATNTCTTVPSDNGRFGLLNIDGTILLPLIYNDIKVIDFKNKIWEVTSNDGVYIYDENTRKLSPKDGKEIVKAKLPEIKGYEFIVNYDFKEDSKIDIKPTDYLVKELAENLWFVVDVENSKSGIYNSTTNRWVVKPNYGIKLYTRDMSKNYTPQIVKFSLTDGGVNYYKELLADAFNATNELKGRGFYVINHNDKNSQTKKDFYKKVGQCIVFDENKVLAEIPYYVNNTLTKKLWDINKTTKILVVQDVVEFQNDKFYGLANRKGKILFKKQDRESNFEFVQFGGKTFASFHHYDKTEDILELVNEDETIAFNDYEILTKTENGNAIIAKKQGLWGMLDKNGKLILPFEYDKLYILETPYISAVKNGLNGVVDENNKEIIPFISSENIVACYGDFYSTGRFGFTSNMHYCRDADGKPSYCINLYDKSGNYIGTYSRIQKNDKGSGIFIFDEYQKISRVLNYDKKTGKTNIIEDSWASWKKIDDEYGSGSSSGSMSKDWMEHAKSYLFHFENFKKACENFKSSTSNINKKAVQYELDNLKSVNRVIINVLNHPNDKSLTVEEQKQYKAIAQQKQNDLNNFQEQLNNGVYTVLDALLYQLK